MQLTCVWDEDFLIITIISLKSPPRFSNAFHEKKKVGVLHTVGQISMLSAFLSQPVSNANFVCPQILIAARRRDKIIAL